MRPLRTILAMSAASAITVAGAVLTSPAANAATVSITVDCLNGLANFATPTVITVHPGDTITITGDAVNACTRAGTALPGATAYLSDWPGAPTLLDTSDFVGTQPFTWTVRTDAPLGTTGTMFGVGALGDAFNPPSSTYFALAIVAAPPPPPVVTDDDPADHDAQESAHDDGASHEGATAPEDVTSHEDAPSHQDVTSQEDATSHIPPSTHEAPATHARAPHHSKHARTHD